MLISMTYTVLRYLYTEAIKSPVNRLGANDSQATRTRDA